jgi:hypothetical protein
MEDLVHAQRMDAGLGLDTGKFDRNSARGVVVHSLKLPIRQSWNTIICGVTILHYLKREVWYLTDHITKMFWLQSASRIHYV